MRQILVLLILVAAVVAMVLVYRWWTRRSGFQLRRIAEIPTSEPNPSLPPLDEGVLDAMLLEDPGPPGHLTAYIDEAQAFESGEPRAGADSEVQ